MKLLVPRDVSGKLFSMIRPKIFSVCAGLFFGFSVFAQSPEFKSSDLNKFHPQKTPLPHGLILKTADRLAICGDSITEQKMYSRIMETYLTVCVPEFNITTRQFGWGGETAEGFLNRMTNDVLRFKPTIATTCYGMNDHSYRSYEKSIGDKYREKSTAIVEAFKNNGARVIQGSPGCVGPLVPWAKTNAEELNLNLCKLRNIGIEIAEKEKIYFADIFWPMLQADLAAREKYGTNYHIAGKDGVHPDWAGHLIMAYSFLKSFGLDGDIGAFTVNLKSNEAEVSKGHEMISFKENELKIKSSKYPFCAAGELSDDNNIRSGMQFVPFEKELNRLILIVKNGAAKNYKIGWGDQSKTFSAEQLGRGINLGEEFPTNPFTKSFEKVDAAIATKQAYETKQIKQIFRSPEAKANMEETVANTEKERAQLVNEIKNAFVPVTHTIKISPE